MTARYDGHGWKVTREDGHQDAIGLKGPHRQDGRQDAKVTRMA